MEITLLGPTGALVQPRVGLESKNARAHASTRNQNMVGSHVKRGTWDLIPKPRNAIWENVQVSSNDLFHVPNFSRRNFFGTVLVIRSIVLIYLKCVVFVSFCLALSKVKFMVQLSWCNLFCWHERFLFSKWCLGSVVIVVSVHNQLWPGD